MADGVNTTMANRVNELWKGDDALPALVEAAEAVEGMLSHPGWAAVQRVLQEEVALIDSALDGGPAKEAAEYAKAHGRRSALRSAEDAARAIISKAATRHRKALEQQATASGAGESALERTGV